MAKTERIGERLQRFKSDGSLGVVKDTIFRRCFWFASDVPLAPFALGSSGIEVEGPPTPRNIIFPDGTVFLGNTRADCFFSVSNEVGDVTRQIEVIEARDIDGVQREVTYKKDVVSSEPVRKIVEIPKPIATSTATAGDK